RCRTPFTSTDPTPLDFPQMRDLAGEPLSRHHLVLIVTSVTLVTTSHRVWFMSYFLIVIETRADFSDGGDEVFSNFLDRDESLTCLAAKGDLDTKRAKSRSQSSQMIADCLGGLGEGPGPLLRVRLLFHDECE